MTILCYVRPWNEEQFKIIAEHAFPGKELHFVSDFPNHMPYQLQERLVENFKTLQGQNELLLPEEEMHDIIIRCRLLRNIDIKQARQLVNACYLSVKEVFNHVKPTHVIGLTVDSYVIDIIRYVSEEYGLKYWGVIGTFINGYSRISARGESNFCRQASDNEVNEVYNRLVNLGEKPVFLSTLTSLQSTKRLWQRNKFKKYLRKWYMRLIRLKSSSHRYCYHYWHSQIIASIPGEKIDLEYFDDFGAGIKTNSCFIPLQYFPECTVDYWSKNSNYVDYYKVLLDVVNTLSGQNISIYIKEHPNCLAIRPKGFYDKLKAVPGVHLITPLVDSYELIRNTSFTLVWTGSAGLEAALRGKSVVHLGEPYYITDSSLFIEWDTFKQSFNLPQLVPTLEDKKQIIRQVLSSTIKASFYSDPRKLTPQENFKIAAALGLEIRSEFSQKEYDAQSLDLELCLSEK